MMRREIFWPITSDIRQVKAVSDRDELQRKHVKHVLIGFYIRRHIEQFTQDNALAMTESAIKP